MTTPPSDRTRVRRRPMRQPTILGLAALLAASCAATVTDSQKEAMVILERAETLLGGPEKLAAIVTLQVTAACSGPRGPYQTTIASRSNGDLYFRQVFPRWGERRGGLVGDQYWRQELHGEVETIDRRLAMVMRFHDFHRLIINMDHRFSRLEAAEKEAFFGVEAQKVEMLDELGQPAAAYFSESIGLPLGFAITDPERPDSAFITVRLGKWQQVGDVILFKQAILDEGDYTFQFNYIDIRLNPDIDSLLVIPGSEPDHPDTTAEG